MINYLTAQLHDQRVGSDGNIDNSTPFGTLNHEDFADFYDSLETNDADDTTLFAHVTKQHKGLHPGDFCKVLSSSANKQPTSATKQSSGNNNKATKLTKVNELNIDGHLYRQVNVSKTYDISTCTQSTDLGSPS